MSDAKRLAEMLRARNPCILIPTYEETLARHLVCDSVVDSDCSFWLWSATEGLTDGLVVSPAVPDTTHPAAAFVHLCQLHGKMIVMAFDLAGHLEDPRTLRAVRDLIADFEQTGNTLILVDHEDGFPQAVLSHATRFDLSLPDDRELEQIVRKTLRACHERSRIKVDLARSSLKTIIRNLRGLSRRQAERVIVDSVAVDSRFDERDINTVLARKRQLLRGDGLLEYVESPTDLTEIGGLQRLKRWLMQRKDALTDEAAEFGLEAPRGVLLLGVQGAGKSLCAKAIATAWQRPLLRMDTGALYDRYVGESERRLRATLQQAERMAPIVLWVDEIEKAFASAASRSIDGGLSQRMFGALLTWMQDHREPVFLVATANDIEALPPELLRKGRFDEIFFVDLPGLDVRKEILAIHLRKRSRDPESFDLHKLAKESEGFSGAEIEQAIISAMHDAFAGEHTLTTELIADILDTSPPLSATMSEQVQALRTWAKKRCVPAD